ncbi:MAG: DUF512 domain-containing protein [Bacillota bacterium]
MKKLLTEAYILDVINDSIAHQTGIEPGDVLLSINSQPVLDILDYYALTQDEQLVLEIKKRNGEIWLFEIEKDLDESLGITFRDNCFDSFKKCMNNCPFCFIKGLPKGLRSSLYLRDDDYRHSFLFGNYITLTNLSFDQMKRIVDLKLSPLYISVHTTNPSLRSYMLNNTNAANIIEQLQCFAASGIKMHCQVVLCPGLNDGKELDRTIHDLAELYPFVETLAVVPVGLTKYNLNKQVFLRPYSKEECDQIIVQLHEWQGILQKKLGSRFVFAADEFYLKSSFGIPELNEYEDFSQIENGVGLARDFQEDFKLKAKILINKNLPDKLSNTTVLIVTGELAYPIIQDLIKNISSYYKKIKLVLIKNKFFGYPVSVTGLLTGHDIANTLKDHLNDKNSRVLLPDIVLKKDSELFLDDMTLKEFKRIVGAEVKLIQTNGGALAAELIGGDKQNV